MTRLTFSFFAGAYLGAAWAMRAVDTMTGAIRR
jgi:hypothetical protein